VSLREYKAKRDFGRTSEPPESQGKSAGAGLRYVIQKHRASHLHYDLRLEEDGVLRSWAVPKEPVDEIGVKRLALQTEDHPLGYEDFEGIIPEGEYGAGTVAIWDRGSYRPLEKNKDKVVIEISGRRLAGRFALVRIKSREGRPQTWLFFKIGNKLSPSRADGKRPKAVGRKRRPVPREGS
jgi:DNA ligase D-like protein (predicted 3'-phosphoesterase)